jgi:AAA+ superfamily predicted ATPase
MNEGIIASLRRAVAQNPDDLELVLHLAQILLESGNTSDAIGLAGSVLHREPTNTHARELIALCIAAAASSAAADSAPPAEESLNGEAIAAFDAPAPPSVEYDWSAAEDEVSDLAQPMFVGTPPDPIAPAFDAEFTGLTLKDVGGMSAVKERLNAAFLAPLRNPELRALYGKSLKGGLLMYGPPGCGKTYIARAVAGELGAKFISVGIADVLDSMLGVSEQNIHALFQFARREAPCVLFFDEVDSLGQRRSQTQNTAMRGTVNQLLTELDGLTEANDGVFVLAATNQPWDVDPALRRPGRFDRIVLVLPPDLAARESIFRHHLSGRPVEGIDLARLARESDGLSGADIAYVCEVAAEEALLDSVRIGSARLMTMSDVRAALSHAQPSTNAWLNSARNVVLFGDDDGTYAELKAYLKKVKRL